MESNSLLNNKKRKRFCCCLSADSSDEEHPQSIENHSFVSVSNKFLNFSIKKYASNKIYFLGSDSIKFVTCFKHVLIENKSASSSTISSKLTLKRLAIRNKKSLFMKSDEGIRVADSGLESIPSEMVCKKFAKLVNSRKKMQNCLIVNCGTSAMCMKFCKYLSVIALEENQMNIEILVNNSLIYKVADKIRVVNCSLQDYHLSEEIDLVILSVNAPYLNLEDDLMISEHFPSLMEEIQKGLEISENLILSVPCNFNPESFCSLLSEFYSYSCIEFMLYFEGLNIKNLFILLGKITDINSDAIVNSIASRLNLKYKQKAFIGNLITKLSLRKVLEIMSEVDRNSLLLSSIENYEKRAFKFFELVRSEGVPLSDTLVFYNGIDGEEVTAELKEINEFYLEYKTQGESMIEINDFQVTGKENILQYLSSLKRTESSSINSLLNLIEL